MKKYGFVYIWYDRKHKRYYVGCHWGTVDDGYICSSSNMKSAYKRRKEDFTRKILKSNIENRESLLEEEYKWLSLMKKEELGVRYYNLHNHHFNHWSKNEQQAKTLSERISQKTKEAMQRPEVRKKYLAGLAKRDNGASRPEVRAKMSASNKGKNTGKDNSKAIVMAAAANRGRKLTEEHKEKIKETTAFKTLNNMKIKCNYCDFIGNKGNVARYHNDKCKHRPK